MEAKSIELTQLKKLSKKRTSSVLVILVIVALAVTTFISASASANKQAPIEQAAGARLSATNSTPNPGIDVDCEKPVLTIAIQIDRSGSVYYNRNTYINTVRTFVNNLYNKFVLSGGEVKLVIFAFGARSVIQNDTQTTASGDQLVLSMTSESSRDSLLNVVDNIYFKQYANGNTYHSASGSPYDRARGYNPLQQGSLNWAVTNYDDALLDIARIASTPYFNNPDPGQHIDLALFLTDGEPNVHNGSTRSFSPSNVPSDWTEESYVNQGADYASDTVTALRNGTSVAGLPARPPMAVRGVLVAADAENYMETVFGVGQDNYLFASNFGSELNKQLDKIVNTLSEGVCALEVVEPSISVEVNPSNISLTEEQTRTYTITVRNTSPVPVNDLVVTINGGYFTTIPNLGPQGSGDGVATRTNSISLPLGGNLPNEIRIDVKGTAVPTSEQKFADGSSEQEVNGGDEINVSITRLALPA